MIFCFSLFHETRLEPRNKNNKPLIDLQVSKQAPHLESVNLIKLRLEIEGKINQMQKHA